MKITKEDLPKIRKILYEYEKHSREHFLLETEMLKIAMEMVEKLDKE